MNYATGALLAAIFGFVGYKAFFDKKTDDDSAADPADLPARPTPSPRPAPSPRPKPQLPPLPAPPPVAPPAPAKPKSPSGGSVIQPAGFPLMQGSRGFYVKALQVKLGVTADGIFGPKTQQALLSKYKVSSVSAELYRQIVLGEKAPASPAPATPASAPTGYPIGKAFLAMYEVRTNAKVGKYVLERISYDNDKLISLFEGKTDSYLKGFKQQFDAFYRNQRQFDGTAKNLTLIGSLRRSFNSRVTAIATKLEGL